MKISLLHPSRSRPEKSYETIKKWYDRSGNVGMTGIEFIISIDNNDPMLKRYLELYTRVDNGEEVYCTFQGSPLFCIRDNNRSAVDAINATAKHAHGDIFIVVSDDTDCPENWAVDLLKYLEGKEDFIVKVSDGIQPWIITMPIMDRKYYDRFGYVYYPEYAHLFCDTELTCVADLMGRKIEVPMLFRHLHYSTGASVKDSVSDKADATWQQGETLFIERAKRKFDLPKEINGQIKSADMLSWLKTRAGIIQY